jgi:hypothetical protein
VPAEKLLPQEGRIAEMIRHARRLSGHAVEEIEALVEKARETIEDRTR